MTSQQPIFDEEGNEDPEVRMPAILRAKSMIITDEEFQQCEQQSITNIPTVEPEENGEDPTAEVELITGGVETNDDHQEHDASASAEVAAEPSTEVEPATIDDEEKKEEIEDNADAEANIDIESEVEKPNVIQSSVESTKPVVSAEQIDGHKVKLPAVWTPRNARGHACFIYHFFRHVSCVRIRARFMYHPHGICHTDTHIHFAVNRSLSATGSSTGTTTSRHVI